MDIVAICCAPVLQLQLIGQLLCCCNSLYHDPWSANQLRISYVDPGGHMHIQIFPDLGVRTIVIGLFTGLCHASDARWIHE